MSKDEQKDEALNPIGLKLYLVRRARNWTQDQLARSIGISRVALSRAENGHFAGERSKSFYLIRKFLEATQ